MLKEELDAAAGRHPDVRYKPMLIDATYAVLISHTGDALVVPALNRDGDCLSDMVLQLFGSIAGAESQLLAFDEDFQRDGGDGRGAARHGADAAGQERRQPARDDPGGRLGAALHGRRRSTGFPRDLRGGARDGGEDIRTATSGATGTDEFTDEVIKRVRTKLDVWAALGESALRY